METEKFIWSLDLAITLDNCDEKKFNESDIIDFAKKTTSIIDEGQEIVGIVNPFGDHSEDMKGFRLIHENKNSLITAHFIFKSKKAYINIHSCNGYRPSEVINFASKFFDTDKYLCQKIFRE